MSIALRVATLLITLMCLVTAMRWMIDPAAAAAALRMDLLEGMGASTQIGDISAFFLAGGVMILLGQRSGQARWLLGAAILFGSAALMRTLAFALGHAPFAAEFIAPEIVMTALLAIAAHLRRDETGQEAPASS